MMVNVRQYMRPDGHMVPQTVEVSDACEEAYKSITARGWNLGAEVLMTGHVSITVEDRKKEEDIEIRVVVNGPAVITAIEQVLTKAAQRAV